MQAQAEGQASSPTLDTSSSGAGSTWRRGVAVVGASLLIAETIFAVRQPPRTEPLRDTAPMSLDWWRHPIERNALHRLPTARGELTAVYARRGTDDVWFAGSGGLVVRSRDAGRTWESMNLRAQTQAPAAPASSGAPRKGASADVNETARTTPPVRLASFELRQAQSPQQQVQQKGSVTVVPSVVGLDSALALKTIMGERLRHRVDYVSGSNRSLAGMVIRQAPAAGSQVPQGSVVTIDVSVYAPPVTQRGPDSTPPAQSNSVAQPRRDANVIAPQVDSASFFPRFTAICFAPSGTGWVLGERGTAFRSTDDGATWTQVPTGYEGAFGPIVCRDSLGAIAGTDNGIVRLDSTFEIRNNGVRVNSIALGTQGTLWASSAELPGSRVARDVIVRSSDAGRTWTPDNRFIKRPSPAIAFADSLNGFVSDSTGIIATRDGGRSWRHTFGCVPTLAIWLPVTLVVASADVGLRIGAGGRTWTTRDGWASCWPSAQFIAASSVSLAPASADTWYAAAGGAFRSTDGGRTWHSLITTARFSTVQFRDSLRGVASVENGLVASTANGGRTWTAVRLDSLETLPPVHFAQRTEEELFAANDNDTQFRSRNGGRSWELHQPRDSVVPLVFSTSQRGWGLVGERMLATRDGGVSWTAGTPSGALRALPLIFSLDLFDNQLRGISFLRDGDGASRAWVTTTQGSLVSFDGSAWDTLAANVIAASPVTRTLGYGLDTLGNLVRSTDGGRAWTTVPIDAPRKYPAPWYYGLVALTVGGTLAASRVKRPRDGEREKSIADILVSDRPLREGDRDVLDFGKIAAGLSRFIRNSRTEPPLTIAVTGPWGTGKSSLMNLLRRDLERRRFRTIWFNAWHHQREESLLASLLESIRLTATPPMWTPKGLRFRRRLLARRIARYKVPALTLLPIFAFAVGYILKDPAKRMADLGQFFASLVGVFSQDGGATVAQGSGTSPNKTAIALTISIVGTVLTYLKGLKAFGVKPAEVARSVVSAGRVRTIESQPAFRYQFARDFSEVTEALKPERIVIFIDDLDRCKPEQVLEILEAINFLAESGDCVVVLGIDRERVTGCVAIGFKEVATVLAATRAQTGGPAGMPDIGGAREPGKSDIEYQLDYARHYLEKLLNMEVPIPPATAAGLGEVMTNAGPPPRREDGEEPVEDAELRERDRRRMRGRVYAGIVSAVVLAAFVIGFKGTFQRAPRPDAGSPPAAAVVPGPAPTPTIDAPVQPRTPTPAATQDRRVPVPLVAGMPATTAWWLHLLSVVAALGGVLWLITPREENQVEDSAAFATALRAWAPVLFEEHPTPRSAKKFLNKMRFLSMAQRAPAARRSPAEAALSRLSGVPWLNRLLAAFAPREQTQEMLLPGSIPEATLVSLNVIRERYPQWLMDPRFWQSDLRRYVEQHLQPIPDDIRLALEALPQIGATVNLAHCAEPWSRLEVWVREG